MQGPQSVLSCSACFSGPLVHIHRCTAQVPEQWPDSSRILCCVLQVFAFYEMGSDLGSSHLVKGNPTEYFRRAGSGSSYGAGVKLGAVRAEYATDNNSGKGALFLRYGERY